MSGSRSSFVLAEHRYQEAFDPSIKATYAGARELIHDTNLGLAVGTTVANALFEACNTPPKAFAVAVIGNDDVSSFITAPPVFNLQSDTYDIDEATPFKVMAMQIDWLNETTTYEVRA